MSATLIACLLAPGCSAQTPAAPAVTPMPKGRWATAALAHSFHEGAMPCSQPVAKGASYLWVRRRNSDPDDAIVVGLPEVMPELIRLVDGAASGRTVVTRTALEGHPEVVAAAARRTNHPTLIEVAGLWDELFPMAPNVQSPGVPNAAVDATTASEIREVLERYGRESEQGAIGEEHYGTGRVVAQSLRNSMLWFNKVTSSDRSPAVGWRWRHHFIIGDTIQSAMMFGVHGSGAHDGVHGAEGAKYLIFVGETMVDAKRNLVEVDVVAAAKFADGRATVVHRAGKLFDDQSARVSPRAFRPAAMVRRTKADGLVVLGQAAVIDALSELCFAEDIVHGRATENWIPLSPWPFAGRDDDRCHGGCGPYETSGGIGASCQGDGDCEPRLGCAAQACTLRQRGQAPAEPSVAGSCTSDIDCDAGQVCSVGACVTTQGRP